MRRVHLVPPGESCESHQQRRRIRFQQDWSNDATRLPWTSEFNTGDVVMIEPNGRQTIMASFEFPERNAFGPDGALYVSNVDFGAPPIGLGQIVRIEIPK